MQELKDKLSRHLRQLAPHVKERETGRLLVDALERIIHLENEVEIQSYWGPRWEAEHEENVRLRQEIDLLKAASPAPASGPVES